MQIRELLEKQKELDAYITKEKGLGDPYDEKFLEPRKLALLVEVGELANATRCFKYWSEKESESKERKLDELADCIHFTLSLMNLDGMASDIEMKDIYEEAVNLLSQYGECLDITEEFNALYEVVVNEKWGDVLIALIGLGVFLGFTISEIEQAYIKKHEKNYNRQKEGY